MPAQTRSPSSQLAAELRKVGLTEVDDSTRRRAEYSTDASLYRVVPQVVAFPRAVDEVVAALDVCRRLGVPLTARGAGTSIAGNAVGTGLVLDFSRHLNRVLDDRPGGADRRDRARHRAGRPAAGGAAARAAVRPRPVDPQPLHARRHDRQQRLRLAGPGLRPDVGQRRRARRAHRHRRAAARCPVRRRTSPTLTALQDVVGAQPRDDPHRVRPLRPAGLRLLAGAPAARARLRRRPGARRHRGHARGRARAPRSGWSVRRRPRCWSRSATPTWRRPPTPYRRCLPYRADRDRGPGRADRRRRRRDAAGRRAVPALPRGAGWLFVELAGATEAELLATAPRVIAAAGALDARVVTDAGRGRGAVADPGGRRRARVPADGRQAPYSGWEDAAVPPEQLGAYLREFEALMTVARRDRRAVRALRRRLRARPDRLPARSAPTAPACSAHSCSTRRNWSPRTADRCRASTATAGPAASCCRSCTRPRRSTLFAAVEGRLRPRRPAEPGRDRAAEPARRRPAAARSAAVPQEPRVRLLRRRRRLLRGRAPVHRRRQVPCRHDRGRRRDVPVLPGHPQREGQHPRPGAGAAGDGQRHAGAGRLARSRGPRVARPLPRVQGLLVGLPDRRRHGHLQGRGAAPVLPPTAPADVSTTASAGSPAGPGSRRRRRNSANAMLAGPLAGLGKRFAGIDARRDAPRFAGPTFRAWFAEHPSAAGDPVMLWVDTFTDHFTPEVGIAAVAGARTRRLLGPHPGRRASCCGLTWISTGQLDAARKILRRSVSALEPAAAAGRPDRRPRTVLHGRLPGRRRAPVHRRRRPGARGHGRRRHPYARRTAHGAQDRTSRPHRGTRTSPSRTATTTP